MIGFNQKTIATRKVIIAIVFFACLASYFLAGLIFWPKDFVFQSMLGTASFCLTVFIGVMAFIKFFTRKKNKYLFIGSGFLAVAALEGYSLFVSSQIGSALWTASRILLAAFLLLSLKGWREGEGMQKGMKPRVYITAAASALLIILGVTLLPSFDPYWKFLFFTRPLELPAAALFGIGVFAYWQKHYWKFKFFEFWFLLSLLTAFFGQVYMAMSGEYFDALFNLGYVIVIISYVLALIGLLMSTYAAFKEVEAEKQIHQGHTKGEYYLKEKN